MEQSRNNSKLKKLPVFCTVLGSILILTIILCRFRNGSEIKNIIKLCVFTGAVVLLLGLYFYTFSDNVRKMPYFNTIFITDLFLAILFILIPDKKLPHSLLLLGGVITAVLFDTYLGIFVTHILIIFAGFAGIINVNYLTYLVVLGSILCFMVPNMKKIKAIVPVLIIILSVQMILLIIGNNFELEQVFYIKVIYEVIVTIIIALSSMLLFILYKYSMYKSAKKHVKTVKSKEYTHLEILSENFPLIKKLKETSPKVYEHAQIVSEVSGQAAKAAGLNVLLAKAGGMYHEIGKLDNSDYIKDGVKYAAEYRLPEDVINIIKSHNLKYAKPASPESAVVNLAISVLSARDFFRRSKEESRQRDEADLNKLTNKAIEELFTMRLTKNSLDESGLTLKQFHSLKDFFLRL